MNGFDDMIDDIAHSGRCVSSLDHLMSLAWVRVRGSLYGEGLGLGVGGDARARIRGG